MKQKEPLKGKNTPEKTVKQTTIHKEKDYQKMSKKSHLHPKVRRRLINQDPVPQNTKNPDPPQKTTPQQRSKMPTELTIKMLRKGL
jgi:hypothetical protein